LDTLLLKGCAQTTLKMTSDKYVPKN